MAVPGAGLCPYLTVEELGGGGAGARSGLSTERAGGGGGSNGVPFPQACAEVAKEGLRGGRTMARLQKYPGRAQGRVSSSLGRLGCTGASQTHPPWFPSRRAGTGAGQLGAQWSLGPEPGWGPGPDSCQSVPT